MNDSQSSSSGPVSQNSRTAVNPSMSRSASPRAAVPRSPGSHLEMPSAGSSSEVTEARMEAPPLPRKIGELSNASGETHSLPQYAEPGDTASAPISENADAPSEPMEDLAPHPAEMPERMEAAGRHHRSDSESTVGSASSSQATVIEEPTAGTNVTVQPRMPMPSMPGESQTWYSALRSRNHGPIQSLGGVRPPTLIRLIAILFALIVDVGAWIVVIIVLKNHNSSNNNSSTDDDNDGNGGGTSLSQNIIFVSIAFAIIGILLLVFFERTVFVIRAERYRFSHPNASHSGRGGDESLGVMPWSRPSLPTYAAAIGFRGTGDAEDVEIARSGGAPPPTYGKSKDDRLLARNSIRRSMASNSTMSAGDSIEMSNSTEGRPISYNTSALLQNQPARNVPSSLSRATHVDDMQDVDLSSPVVPTRREGVNAAPQLRISTASEVLDNHGGHGVGNELVVASATDSARSIIMQRDAEQARSIGAALSRSRVVSPTNLP